VLADNNSTDGTAELAEQAAQRLGLRYRRVFETKMGKYRALNAALATVTTPLVVSVDADTYLHRDALRYLIAASRADRRANTYARAPVRSSPGTPLPTS
jgi:biofilm PGA synthesis N-glycosyltransferase PgaC